VSKLLYQDSTIHFGKHKGKTVQEVQRTDKSYLKWLVNNTDWKIKYTLNPKELVIPEKTKTLYQNSTITFGKLSKEVMMKIVGKFLVELKTMVKDKDIIITVSDDSLDYLVDKGFDPKMGARPLQRVIDKEIKRPLSREILFGNLKQGGTVHVDVKDGDIVLECEARVHEVTEA